MMAEAEQQVQSEQQEQGKNTKVLIAVDRSENSEHAFDNYAEHVHKPTNEVIVFHVSDQVKMPTHALFSEGIGFSPEEMRHQVEELKHKNKELEEKYNLKCNAVQMKHKFLIVSEDAHGPGHAICESAKKHSVNLIVVGSRGLGAFRQTILGSISNYVIHHSHIPSLVCPGDKHGREHHHHHH